MKISNREIGEKHKPYVIAEISGNHNGSFLKAKELIDSEIPAFMAGDYNIIPQAEDAANIGAWEQDALFLPESRTEFRRILNLGFT